MAEAESFIAERQEITPLSFADDLSVASVLTGLAGASVASEYVEAPSKKKRPYNWVAGVERDYKGKIIRTCGIAGCQYKANELSNMKRHKSFKHGINVVWFSCDQDNCDYKTKEAGHLKRHKQHVHNMGVVWHHCDECEFKTKEASKLKRHKSFKHK